MQVLFDLIVLAIVIACPLSMMRMMRKGGHSGHVMPMPTQPEATNVPQRITDLEAEVARLRGQAAAPAETTPTPGCHQ